MLLPVLLVFNAVDNAAIAQSAEAVPLPKPRPSLNLSDDTPRPKTPPPTKQPKLQVDSKGAQARVYQTSCPAHLHNLVRAKMLPPIKQGRCRQQSPLSVTGIRIGARTVDFSQPAILNCTMATAVAEWTKQINNYALAVFNTGVSQVQIGTSFMCRNRNGATDTPISEHGFANALDITGVILESGKRIALPADWSGDGAEARFMQQAHTAACGAFSTVLGPDANALHADHLHLDLGCHGSTCTAMICE